MYVAARFNGNNFMPVLDWLRTDIAYPMADGSTALYFNRLDYVIFDLFLLQRRCYCRLYEEEIARANERFGAMDKNNVQALRQYDVKPEAIMHLLLSRY
jgi:mannonate dehydratase